MIFQHTFEKVLAGEKTQTRRLIQGVNLAFDTDGTPVATDSPFWSGGNVDVVMRENGRVIYEVGKTYAVQPGRTKKAVGRIEITRIWREDVREISDADVRAEGFVSFSEFIRVWVKMHDKHSLQKWYSGVSQDSWQVFTADADAALYQAWALEFKLVGT